MKKRLLIMIQMIIVLIILNTKVEATTGKINSETVRVRSEATTNSNIITQLDKNDEIEILEELDGWYKVKFKEEGKEKTGYISKKLVDIKEEEKQEPVETEPVEETNRENIEEVIQTEQNQQYMLKQKIVIKILPLINSIEIAEIENGEIKIIEEMNDWCKVENENVAGWIRTNKLKTAISNNEEKETEVPSVPTTPKVINNTEPEEVDSKEEEPKETEKVIRKGYVNTESLKVRKEANTSSEVISSLKKNDEISIIGEQEGWYKIKNGQQVGYVSSKYISDTKVLEATSRGTNTRNDNIAQKEQEKEEPRSEEKVATGTKGEEVVSYAKKYLGYKYISGGTSPTSGFDCSGFTQYVYKNFGIEISRTSRAQINNGTAVDKSNLQTGDLVIFNGDSNKTIGHVGIYIGGGNFIHASNPSDGVKITPLDSSYYKARYVGARRVI